MTKIQLADYYPLIREILENGGSFTLTVTGSSMYPFILGNRDQVTLSPITGELKKYDLPLYRREDGAFVLHRIVRVEADGTYTCCGDHQWILERGLRRDQMIAVATEFVRKGRHLTNKNLLYRMYCVVWTWMLRLRKLIFSLRPWLKNRVRKFRAKREK